jgi:hypothetical protein
MWVFLPVRRFVFFCTLVLGFFLFLVAWVAGFAVLLGCWPFLDLALLAFPCFVCGLLALPLCGAALTSLCRPQREVSKRKRLKPQILKWVPRTVVVVVHLESVFSHIRRQ